MPKNQNYGYSGRLNIQYPSSSLPMYLLKSCYLSLRLTIFLLKFSLVFGLTSAAGATVETMQFNAILQGFLEKDYLVSIQFILFSSATS